MRRTPIGKFFAGSTRMLCSPKLPYYPGLKKFTDTPYKEWENQGLDLDQWVESLHGQKLDTQHSPLFLKILVASCFQEIQNSQAFSLSEFDNDDWDNRIANSHAENQTQKKGQQTDNESCLNKIVEFHVTEWVNKMIRQDFLAFDLKKVTQQYAHKVLERIFADYILGRNDIQPRDHISQERHKRLMPELCRLEKKADIILSIHAKEKQNTLDDVTVRRFINLRHLFRSVSTFDLGSENESVAAFSRRSP